ncbi:MAG TPA: hypothetical protein VFD25_01520, partial [Clostridia bacterium]|nr:hypothetical protein [Clostridia bacterium]
ASYTEAKETVLNFLSPDGEISFDDYFDMESLFGAIEDALSSTDLLVIAAPLPLYNDLKATLINAFDMKTEQNLAIKFALGSTLSEDDAILAHCTVPLSSEILLTADGLYSGFYVESHGQYIMLLPLDKGRLTFLFERSSFPFLEQSPTYENIEQAEPENAEDVRIKDKYIDEAFSLIRLLRENSHKVALPSNPPSEYLKSMLSNSDEYTEHFKFTPHIEDKGNKKSGEYAAQIAKISRELAAADIGASISDIYNEPDSEEGKETFIFICVADERKAIVRKLFANPDESDDELLKEAAFELLLLIKKISSDLLAIKEALFDNDTVNVPTDDHNNDFGAIVDSDEHSDDDDWSDLFDSAVENDTSGTIGKKGVIVAVVLIVLALLISVLVGLKTTGVFDKLFGGKEKTTKTSQVTKSNPVTDTPVITAFNPNETINPSETADLTNTTTTDTTTATPTPDPKPNPKPDPKPDTEPGDSETTTTTAPTTTTTEQTTTTTEQTTTTTEPTAADEEPDPQVDDE